MPRFGWHAVSAALAVISLVSACATAETPSSAAPPLIICGTTLSNSAAGPSVEHIGTPAPTVTQPTVGDVIFVRVSDDCAHGATVSLTPAGALVIDRVAPAKDGLPAAVVLKPVTRSVPTQLIATRAGRLLGSINIRLIGS